MPAVSGLTRSVALVRRGGRLGSQRTRVGSEVGVGAGLGQAGDRGREQHEDDHRERGSGGDLRDAVGVKVGEVKDQLYADEGQDQR